MYLKIGTPRWWPLVLSQKWCSLINIIFDKITFYSKMPLFYDKDCVNFHPVFGINHLPPTWMQSEERTRVSSSWFVANRYSVAIMILRSTDTHWRQCINSVSFWTSSLNIFNFSRCNIVSSESDVRDVVVLVVVVVFVKRDMRWCVLWALFFFSLPHSLPFKVTCNSTWFIFCIKKPSWKS